MNSLAEMLTHLVTRKSPRPGYMQRDLDQLWTDLKKLGRYFPALETLNYFEMTLVFR